MSMNKMAILLACISWIALSNAYASDEIKVIPEEVLRYQEVFFHFYRKDEFNALINLKNGIEQKKIFDNAYANKLLLGSLQSSYGLDQLAEKSLINVTKNSRNKRQKSIAEFYMAKQMFENENYDGFEKVVNRVGQSLPKSMLNEYHYMKGIYYIQKEKLKKAEAELEQIAKDSEWRKYLAFNLGASYIKNKSDREGVRFLSSSGSGSPKSEKLLSLRDKANIVLGYYYIRLEIPKKAIRHFEKVRLEGAFSNKALLGLGWAYLQLKQYRNALVPWLALSEGNMLDVTVQEARLASGFAYKQLGAEKKAMVFYQSSINEYEKVKKVFQDEISTAFSENIFSSYLSHNGIDDYSVTKKLSERMDSNKGFLIVDLLKTEKFQKMFNEYRDLKQLQAKIVEWEDMLGKMQLSYDVRYSSQDMAMAPDGSSYDEKLLTLGDKINLQRNRLNILVGMYEEKIRNSFVQALTRKQQYLVAYLSQARFAYAEILDSVNK